MNRSMRVLARVVAFTGLAAISVLHVMWATGSSWPAKNSKQLAEAVAGQSTEMPAAAPTAVVAAGTAATSMLATGILGDGRIQRKSLRAISLFMLLRAALGGEVALKVLQLPPAGERFRSLDRRYYRPFAAVMGLALWGVTFPAKGKT